MKYFIPITNDQLNAIYSDINTSNERIQRDVKYIIEWLEKQPHLPNVTDEKLLGNIIIRCKNRLELVKRRLDAYYTCRALESKDIFSNRDPTNEEFYYALKFAPGMPVSQLTEEGNRIIIYQLFRNSKSTFPDINVLLKVSQTQLDVNLREDITGSAIVVMDFRGANTASISYFITFMRKYLSLLKGIVAYRLNKIVFLNSAPAFHPLISLLRHFVKKDVSDRFIVWNQKDSELSDILPKELLPKDYGGCEKSFDEMHDDWCTFIQQQREWLISEENVTADLSKISRDKLPKKDESVYGLNGSFRKITLD